MQIKIIKKILAVMIVASTISATPGLASACPPKNSATEKSYQKNKPETNKDITSADNSNMFVITQPEVKKQPKIERKNQAQNVIKNPQDYNIKKMNDMLLTPFHSETERKFFVQTIKNFSKCGFFKDWAKDKVNNILNILRSGLTSPDLHPDIATIISDMTEGGCFENWPQNKISELLNLLAQCSYSDAAKRNVLVAISSFIKSDFLKNFSSEMVFDVVCILGECSRVFGNEMNVAIAMKYLASEGYFKAYNQKQIYTVLSILHNCANSDFSKREVAYATTFLIDMENFQNWPLGLIDILDKCLINSWQPAGGIFNSEELVVSAISRLVGCGCFEKCAQESSSKIMNILFRCSGCGCDEKEIENIIKHLKEKGHLNHWLENNITAKKISTSFENSEKTKKTSQKSENDAESKQKTKADASNETAKIHDIVIDLGKKKTTSDKNSKANVLNKPEICLLGKKTYRDDETNSLDKNFSKTIKDLFTEDCLKSGQIGNLPGETISKIMHMLRDHLNNGGSERYVAASIEWLADKQVLLSFSKPEITQIVNILNKCADDVDAKKFVAKSVAMLLTKDFFNDFSAGELENVKNILTKCLDGEGAKPFVALAIKKLIEKGLPV